MDISVADMLDMFFKVFCALLGIGVLSALSFQILMLWRLWGAFQWMEMTERQRANPMYVVQNGNPSPVQFRDNYKGMSITKEEENGAFIPSSDFDAYVREESNQVSRAAGISDEDAAKIILEKINEQNRSKGRTESV